MRVKIKKESLEQLTAARSFFYAYTRKKDIYTLTHAEKRTKEQ